MAEAPGLKKRRTGDWTRKYRRKSKDELANPERSRPRLSADENARRHRVYQSLRFDGSDVEAARILGMGKSAFHMWRVREGLPPLKPAQGIPKAKSGTPREPYLQEELRRLRALLEEPTARLAAERLGITFQTLSDWQRQRAIPPAIKGRDYWARVEAEARSKLSEIDARDRERIAIIERRAAEVEAALQERRRYALAGSAIVKAGIAQSARRGEGFAMLDASAPVTQAEVVAKPAERSVDS